VRNYPKSIVDTLFIKVIASSGSCGINDRNITILYKRKNRGPSTSVLLICVFYIA